MRQFTSPPFRVPLLTEDTPGGGTVNHHLWVAADVTVTVDEDLEMIGTNAARPVLGVEDGLVEIDLTPATIAALRRLLDTAAACYPPDETADRIPGATEARVGELPVGAKVALPPWAAVVGRDGANVVLTAGWLTVLATEDAMVQARVPGAGE